MQDENVTIVWFRSDLRLTDNPALTAAIERGAPIVPVFIWAPEEEAPWAPGAASRWWLHQSLSALQQELKRKDSRFILRSGPTQDALEKLIKETGATAVFWNRRYEPAVRKRDDALLSWLESKQITAETFNSALLCEPWTVATKSGKPFRVFTPFWKACLRMPAPEEPLPAPTTIPAPNRFPKSSDLEDFSLEPKIDWAQGLRATWTPGETGAQERIRIFSENALSSYAEGRDRPDREGVSRLSPHLHFGEISPRQIWHLVQNYTALQQDKAELSGCEAFVRQLYWREFAYHLLFHAPHTPERPLREAYADFPWAPDVEMFRAWKQGNTGFPYIDAGMRQLWATGWMHNRVRMAVASFLVKDLLVPWQDGARWFWDTLVDADLANNTLGWQWTAGCGADAAPYFRIFNPMTQGERFDPQGSYVRHWTPEVAGLPDRYVHRPWEATQAIQAQSGVYARQGYAQPLLNHAEARMRALHAYEIMRNK